MIFFKAFIIGFSIAMPVGPIGMLCIKNSLAHGFRIGFAVGLGAALADCVFGFIAGGGMAFISQFLLDHTAKIKLIGGAILIYLGAVEIKNAKKIPAKNLALRSKKFYKSLIATFFLTLTNPMTILSFIGVFAAIGGISAEKSDIAIIIAGIFLGSLSWWITLASTTSIIRHKIPQSALEKIKIASGLILLGFGMWSFC